MKSSPGSTTIAASPSSTRTSPARAIEDFDEAIRLNPNFAEAFSSRGDAYRLSNDPNHAIADYDRATELKPDDASAFKGRGLVFAEQSQYFYAIQDYDQAIKLDPTDPDTFNNRGNAHANEKDYDLALKDFDQALKLRPDFAYAFNNRGIVFDNLGQTSRAVEDYDRAIALDPNYGDAFNNRGIADLNLGRLDAALADFNNALRIDPKKASALLVAASPSAGWATRPAAMPTSPRPRRSAPMSPTAWKRRACGPKERTAKGENAGGAASTGLQPRRPPPRRDGCLFNRRCVNGLKPDVAQSLVDHSEGAGQDARRARSLRCLPALEVRQGIVVHAFLPPGFWRPGWSAR